MPQPLDIPGLSMIRERGMIFVGRDSGDGFFRVLSHGPESARVRIMTEATRKMERES
jgi:hypothetical protein